MYPAQFEYQVASSFADAARLLAQHEGDSKLLSGGCSLLPLMKLRLAQPGHIIDLNRVPDAAYVRESGDWLHIGALARESDVEHSDVVRNTYPILLDVTSVIADPLIRNMGTVAGNLAHGDPANDHPAAAIALQARMVLQGSAGTREVDASDFFLDLFETALQPDEVLIEVRYPAPYPGCGAAYVKFERQAGDFALAAAAVWVRLEGTRIRESIIAITNVGPVPFRAVDAEAALQGVTVSSDALESGSAAAVKTLAPAHDVRLSGESKVHLARLAVRRALGKAILRAGGPAS
jgi:carbon-monoxide dehydrogenase medium subunit